MTEQHPRFRLLASGKVQQAIGGELTEFDPADWATYAKVGSAKTVRACRIPRTFQVAGDVVKDGWVVRDERGLLAVPNASFAREYEQSMVLEPPAIEAA